MRIFFPIICVTVMVLSTVGMSVPSTTFSSNEQAENISISIPTISESKTSTSVTIPEAATYLNNPGQPILPVVIKKYTFPQGTIINQVNCVPKTFFEKNIIKPLSFAQKPLSYLSGVNIEPTKKDDMVYLSDSLYPSTFFNYQIGVGFNGNEHVTYLTIFFYPVRYVPAKNLLTYTTEVGITINYQEPSSQKTLANDYDLVIIAPREFQKPLERLVTHKDQMGIKTKLITTQEIYRTYEGRDQPEKIKYFIKYAVEEWGVKYVLLVGGMKGQRLWSWYVPVRYSNLDDASNFETQYISDLYYADLYKYNHTTGYAFDDWDSNGNGIFAEWNNQSKDVLDMYPDVSIGRLPCQYRWEVSRIVDRIITYETTTYGKPWFNKMAGVGGDSFDDANSTDYLEGQEESGQALSFMPGFDCTRLWAEGGNVTLTTANIISTLSEGQGFVYFTGHGNPGLWGTHPHDNFTTWINFDLKSMKKLTNEEKLPVVVVGGCHNCQFDVSLLRFLTEGRTAVYRGENVQKCWGWTYASLSTGGSIATIGNTGLGYGTTGDGPVIPDEISGGIPDGIPDCIQYLGGWIEPHFFWVYHNLSKDILGEVHTQTLIDYLNQFPINWSMNWEDHEQYATLVDCKTVQQWVLLGDSSLKIGGYPE